MKFSKAQLIKFGTTNGAYSTVTSREEYDSQITLTDHEANLVLSHFKKIHIGNVKSNRDESSKEFKLYPSGVIIKLNIVYPKPEKTELRLYLSDRAGFKPKSGSIWFMFTKDKYIYIGSMTELEWRSEYSIKDDESDYIYQEYIYETNRIRLERLRERDVFSRDRKVAEKSMKNAKYKCEYDEKHKLFISRFSGFEYLEAHHLIPIKLQNIYEISLDTVSNVFCLCPYCHRAVHHAEIDLARDILYKLGKKHGVLEKYDITMLDLYSFYAVEKIV